jgi:branched-chain amino acid transport system substrate-binding protein
MAVALVSIATLSPACQTFGGDAEQRSARAKSSTGDITIGVLWPLPTSSAGPSFEPHFWHGIETAQREIDAKGGVLGRKLALIRSGEDGTLATGRRVAQEVAENLETVAVLGYLDPTVASVASVTFEYENVVMLVTGTGTGRLTRDGFKRVFRTLPTDEEYGERLAEYARSSGKTRILVVFENDSGGSAVANAFESRAEQLRLSIVDRVAWDRGSERSFEQALSGEHRLGLSAILLAARLPEAADAITILRKLGYDAPILGPDGLDSPALLALAGAEGTVVASVFDSALNDRAARTFADAYRAQHGHDPGAAAAQAYDGLMLLAAGITAAQSSDPNAISAALRAQTDFSGAGGPIRFNARGDAVKRRILLKRVEGGKFRLLGPEGLPGR